MSEAADWVEAWPLGKDGPESGTWRTFVASHRDRPEDISDLWLALLVRRLGLYFEGTIVTGLARISATRPRRNPRHLPREPARLHPSARQPRHRARSPPALGGGLVRRARHRVARLGFARCGGLGTHQPVGELRPSLAATAAEDLHAHGLLPPQSRRVGADVAKLAANRVELSWNDRNLYGVLIKHIVNRATPLRGPLRRQGGAPRRSRAGAATSAAHGPGCEAPRGAPRASIHGRQPQEGGHVLLDARQAARWQWPRGPSITDPARRARRAGGDLRYSGHRIAPARARSPTARARYRIHRLCRGCLPPRVPLAPEPQATPGRGSPRFRGPSAKWRG